MTKSNADANVNAPSSLSTQEALAAQYMEQKSEEAAKHSKGSIENPHDGPIVAAPQAPVSQPEGVVHLNSSVLQSHEEGRITDSSNLAIDPKTGSVITTENKPKPRDHALEFYEFIKEQIKIRKLPVLPKVSYPLPVSAQSGKHYLMADIKFTQIKNLAAKPQGELSGRAGQQGGNDWVIELEMNDGQRFQVKL